MKHIIKKSINLTLVTLFATSFSSFAFAGGSESGDKGLFVPVGGSESGDKGLFVPQSYNRMHHEVEASNMEAMVVKASHSLSGGSSDRAEYIQALYSEEATAKVFEHLGGQNYAKSSKSYELVIEASLYASLLIDQGYADDIHTATFLSSQMYSKQIIRFDSI